MGDAYRRLAALGLTAVTATALAVTTAGSAWATGEVVGASSADAVPGSYVVTLRDDASPRAAATSAATSLTSRYGGEVKRTYSHALNGFHATMSAEQAAKLAADPKVAMVQADLRITVDAVQPNPPSWGLDRIDQRDLPLDSSYSYETGASNVTAYIIDTGIRTTHSTFGGRASWGANTIDTNNTDCQGHGTHVAGTVGGAEYGVAKEVKLVAVKVLNCAGSGTTASVVGGIDWVTANAVKPAVANMSLGGGADATLDAAVRTSVASGVTHVVASGNSSANACSYSPARVAEAISVNASTRTDARASFSNFGTCTDLFAPGEGITSSWNTNDTATNTISGTSMASPHVAGGAALYLAGNPTAAPATVEAALLSAASSDKIGNAGAGSPNKLLFTGSTTTPSITNPGAKANLAGDSVSFQLSVFGGTAPHVFTATGLPDGVTISDGGLVSGSPTTAGTYSVTVTATDSLGVSGSTTFSWLVVEPGAECPTTTNSTAYPIADNSTVSSPITLACGALASATTTVTVDITHTYIGDLVVDLVAPDGSVYNLHNRTGGSADDIKRSFTVDASSEVVVGTWTLRVQDAASLDTGRLNSWSLDV
ncbi:S8 family peptidase [Actinosynnema pretiosum subsp. pretiosum]|uniref:Peptidase S8 and S53 subtilisin kexin sedolisin n=2 Tax=Actinosynnema TaxID=40566 RepID=C6WIA1_ACTMD|nr:S8 family serine peptidase [Actinosynnema mirum]ACU36144.1 peptidase S8 and S53 subtilisin kexin sedolisin [Actinosynnema mirum DSM 43827]AXX29597.1 Alkaline serine exoprotease A precursor [Actinosynnema pretiosum subsp. pretiosum]QUF06167.1 S8 family peptidase [Actinosynnema pretiosum subsp. pretiosum]